MNLFKCTPTQWHLIATSIWMRIYLSGPISAAPKTASVRFDQARGFLEEAFVSFVGRDMRIGDYIACPLDIPAPAFDGPGNHESCPDYLHPCYMRECFKAMAGCSMIALLPGWHKSRGAMFEAQYAEATGMIPLFLHENKSGGLMCDLGETFCALSDAQWVSSVVWGEAVNAGSPPIPETIYPQCKPK